MFGLVWIGGVGLGCCVRVLLWRERGEGRWIFSFVRNRVGGTVDVVDGSRRPDSETGIDANYNYMLVIGCIYISCRFVYIYIS